MSLEIKNLCNFCDKEINNPGSLAAHEKYCSKNPNKQERRGFTDYNKKVLNGEILPHNKGKTYEELYGVEKAAEKKKRQSELSKKNSIFCTANNPIYRPEIKKIIGQKCGGIKNGAGRGKRGYYKGIRCDSTWELAWVIYSLDHNIEFNRNNIWFPYVYTSKERKYYPDFFLPSSNSFIEIKGYFNEMTKEKKNQFPTDKTLIIIGEEEIKPYLEYVYKKYGVRPHNLHELYTHN